VLADKLIAKLALIMILVGYAIMDFIQVQAELQQSVQPALIIAVNVVVKMEKNVNNVYPNSI
jgi:hypothetical protein